MKTQTITTTCDFCGYGGALSRPEDFTSVGVVDLCRWCAHPMGAAGTMKCGRHVIDIDETTWSCSCGARHLSGRMWHEPGRGHVVPIAQNSALPAVLAAVPSLVYATARMHSESM